MDKREGELTMFICCRLTAKKFLAAANFLDLLSVFGETDSEVR
jgi:hypothetical protein